MNSRGSEKTGNGDEAENEEAAYEDPGEKEGLLLCHEAQHCGLASGDKEIRRGAMTLRRLW